MATISEKIQKLVDDNGTTFSWLATKVGMSKSGFYKMIETGSIKVDTLQKIADVFNVPIDSFFSDKVEDLKNRLNFTLSWAKEINYGSSFFTLLVLGTQLQLKKLASINKPISVDELQKVIDYIDKALLAYQKRTNKELTEQDKEHKITFVDELTSAIFSENSSQKDIENIIDENLKTFLQESATEEKKK